MQVIDPTTFYQAQQIAQVVAITVNEIGGLDTNFKFDDLLSQNRIFPNCHQTKSGFYLVFDYGIPRNIWTPYGHWQIIGNMNGKAGTIDRIEERLIKLFRATRAFGVDHPDVDRINSGPIHVAYAIKFLPDPSGNNDGVEAPIADIDSELLQLCDCGSISDQWGRMARGHMRPVPALPH